jgi:hypothetical protein
LFSR